MVPFRWFSQSLGYTSSRPRKSRMKSVCCLPRSVIELPWCRSLPWMLVLRQSRCRCLPGVFAVTEVRSRLPAAVFADRQSPVELWRYPSGLFHVRGVAWRSSQLLVSTSSKYPWPTSGPALGEALPVCQSLGWWHHKRLDQTTRFLK